MALIDSFPEKDTPRPHQVEVIDKIEEAMASGEKFIIIQAPTGSGKSHISATLSNHTKEASKAYKSLVDRRVILNKGREGEYVHAREAFDEPNFGATVLTTTKQLQSQYDDLFDNSDLLKGKSNYICQVDTNFDCDLAPCTLTPTLKLDCHAKSVCPYFNARDEAMKSKFGVLNYSMFLTMPRHVRRRSIIVCDEASELEDELVSFNSVTIEYKRLAREGINCKKLLTENPKKAQYWLSDLYMELRDALKVFDSRFQKANKSSKRQLMSEMNKFKHIQLLFEGINTVISNFDKCQYIIERDAESVTFVPLYVDALAKDVFNSADTIILTSATIIDHKTFAKSLGIEKYKYIEADSTFDAKKSPIYCPGKYSLSFKNIDKNLPRVVDQALQICDHYDDKKGIIHTHNFKITQGLQKKTGSKKRFLIRDKGVPNEKLLDEHYIRKDATVLISPSLAFGTDLSGDAGRFQIIMKLPYLPLGSKRIKTLFELDKDYYQMKMLINLMQMAGRCTRSEEDHADTFILDGQASDVLKKNWAKLPKFFKDRIV
jgi:Rad3-related DNA helicase